MQMEGLELTPMQCRCPNGQAMQSQEKNEYQNPEASVDIAQAIAYLEEVVETASMPTESTRTSSQGTENLEEIVVRLRRTLQSMNAETEGDFSFESDW